jgi:hypothetical protein
MRVACELGKFPDEVSAWMTPKWATRWAAYFSFQSVEDEKPKPGDLEKQFGLKPRG